MNDNYIALSGEGIYAGMVAPSAQTQLEQFIAGMSSNSWAQYMGTNINEMLPRDFDGSLAGILETSGNYMVNNWTNKIAWDDVNKTVSGVGTSNGFVVQPNAQEYAKQFIFDLKTNSFRVKWNPTGQISGHLYDTNCSNFVNGKTYKTPYSGSTDKRIFQYDSFTDQWVVFRDMGGASPTYSARSLECSNHHQCLYATDAGRLWKIPLNGSVASSSVYDGVGAHSLVVLALNNIVVFGGGDGGSKLYKIDLLGSVSLLSDTLPVVPTANGSYTKLIAHPIKSDFLILIDQKENKIYELNAVSGIFTDLSTSGFPAAMSNPNACACSMYGIAVAYWIGIGRLSGITQSQFWVYKP